MFSSLASICLGMICPSCLSFSITKVRVLMCTILVFLFQILNFGHLQPLPFWEPMIHFPQVGFYQIVINSTCIFLLLLVGWVWTLYKEPLLIFQVAWDFWVFLRCHPSEVSLRPLKLVLFSKNPKLNLGYVALHHFEVFWELMFVSFDVLHSTVHCCQFILRVLFDVTIV